MSFKLSKGQKFDLKKQDGSNLTNICFGVNWGMIETSGFLGFGGGKEAVDLDASVGLFDENKNLVGKVYYQMLNAPGVSHSGDDLEGDADGDDGLDNEIITIDTTKLSPEVTDVVFVLNSFRGQDFAKIPFASVRLYEGTPTRVDKVYATYDISNDSSFKGKVSMILGILSKRTGSWEFTAIGEATDDRKLDQTLQTAVKYIQG
jgi:tellurium resistance protein TerZ